MPRPWPEPVREVLAVAGLLDDPPRRGVHLEARHAGRGLSIAAVCASSTIDQTFRYSSVGVP